MSDPNSNPTQTQKILEYMKRGYRITALEALDLFGCFRLASRISEIKLKLGYDVKSEPYKTRGGATIKVYWLETPKPATQAELPL